MNSNRVLPVLGAAIVVLSTSTRPVAAHPPWATLALVAAGAAPAPPAPAAPPAPVASGAAEPTAQGKVVETMNTSGYTYVRVARDGQEELWAAAPEFTVAVGDEVVVPLGMPMQAYRSQSLNRTFDLLYVAEAIRPVGREAAPAPAAAVVQAHAAIGSATAAPDAQGIAKMEGGYAVAELTTRAKELSGKPVSVRARVVKFTPSIMKRNWVHLRDGSGEGGAADLTVTTQDTAAVGDLVIARGVLVTDQDFGSGYRYSVLLQDATLEQQAAK